MSDETKLLDGKIQFYLENPQQALVAFQDIRSKSQEIMHQKDIFIYRCYISQNKFSIPLNEINPDKVSTDLKSVRLFAQYLGNNNRDYVLKEIENLQKEDLDVNDETSLIMWGLIYMHDKKYDQALKVLHSGSSLECLSLSIQCLLHLYRFDIAQKMLKKMIELNEDDVITQLTMASVGLTMGGPKLRDAYNIYQELSEKYRTTSNLLLNGKAATLLGLGDIDEAESVLQEALSRNSNDAETLVNMIVLTQSQGKSIEIVNRYISQLKESHGDHLFVQDLLQKEAEFDRLATNYAASVASK